MIKTVQYKTNINCQSCVRMVQSTLDEMQSIKEWSVKTDHPDKILSIQSQFDANQEVVESIQALGFDIVELEGED